VAMLSDEWWGMIKHAVAEGQRLGVNIGFFNSPGWSQSGGPWIDEDQAMRYIVSKEIHLKGPQNFKGEIPFHEDNFRDIALLAFPAPKDDAYKLSDAELKITSNPSIASLVNLVDGDTVSACVFPEIIGIEDSVIINFDFNKPVNFQTLILHPIHAPFQVSVELQMKNGTKKFTTIKKIRFDRRRIMPNIGPLLYPPLTSSLPQVTSTQFRVIFSEFETYGKGAGFREIELSPAARIDHFIEKQLGIMHPFPLPAWDAYLWSDKKRDLSPDDLIPVSSVIDISDKMDEDGNLTWEVPPGEWKVVRTGTIPTGMRNHPVPKNASGYECDKMSREAVEAHFNGYIGNFLSEVPEENREALRHVVIDSYEVGAQNWTPGLEKVFRDQLGYDPIPWLPVLTGRIVGNEDQSNRFLWDLRRLVADLIAENYAHGLQELCHQNGLELWMENYGHWGFPGEFLKYGGRADIVSGEFWFQNPYWDLGSIECRGASSTANTYGLPIVAAEAFTAGFNFRQYPGIMKARGDWAFCQGINHFVL
ncbi:MAG: hypothetical protein KAI99_10310, partial [Cyclobacteriaceae bacterium]|nr:hypothetical protein [Cyclobacteriaceae bacterium]